MSVWSGNLEEIDSNVLRMSVFDQVMLHRSNNHKAWPDSNRHKSTTLSVNCGRDRFAVGDHFRKLNTIYASHVTVFRGNAGLLLNTPLTNFLTNGCMPTDILLPNNKVATALLAKFMQLYPFPWL